MIQAKGKLVRRFGINIFGNPKYGRLLKRKSMQTDRPYRGGRRQSEYGRQLVEKQKLKISYGLSERQFKNLFLKAKRMPGIAGHNMLVLLESRMDNVIYRSGMAATRSQARQLVTHGHFVLNGRRIDIPSIKLNGGDRIAARERRSTRDLIRQLISSNSGVSIPPWMNVSLDNLQVEILTPPVRDQIVSVADEQLIVDYYSR